MDPQPPTLSATVPLTQPHSRLYPIQVRAFLEASEIVDADADTIEDILDGLDEEVLGVEGDSDVEVQDAEGHDVPQHDDLDDEFLDLLQEGVFSGASS